MDIRQIPIDNKNYASKLRTDLEDSTYVFEFTYNERLERWHVNVMDADEVPIVMGVPLNINFAMLKRFKMLNLPPGLLLLFDATENELEATKESFGDQSLLLYEESE